ncbi:MULTISPECIES: ABC transporter substrate-binding protein [unclassified Streptomyces]|uniref:ABC transporter substrate-binding protein n=1 Tax=unclassified Streptomyces TaxID=2593676 RepID=UPI0037FDCFC3
MSKILRTAGAVLGTVALAGSLAACGGDSLEKSKDTSSSSGSSSTGGGKKGSLVIGAAGFTESAVLAELYSQVLADAGYSTSVTTVKNRELYEPALEKGEIDVVPEYAATLTEFLNAKVNGDKAKDKPLASSDVTATVAELAKLAGPRGLKVLPAGAAVDQNAFAVTKEFAAKNNLKSLSDLGASKAKVKIAAGDECKIRPFCAPGLTSKYGIGVTGIDPKGVGTPQAKQAVKDGVDQLVLTTTTDATLDTYGLVLLQDDKSLQNADNVLPVLNAKHAGGQEIADALGKLTKALTTADLVDLNRKVDAERAKPADVAKQYLQSKGLIKK